MRSDRIHDGHALHLFWRAAATTWYTMGVAPGNWKYQCALLFGLVAPLTLLPYLVWSSDPFVLGFSLLATICIAPIAIVALVVTGGQRHGSKQWQWILLLLINIGLLGTIVVQLVLSDWLRPAAAGRESKRQQGRGESRSSNPGN